MPFAVTWMDLEIIMLSEVSQKNKYHDITYIWHLKCDTNEHIYETETDSQTQRTDLWLPGLVWVGGCGGKEGLGVWEQQMQTVIYRMNKQQGPTVQHRELYSVSCDKP